MHDEARTLPHNLEAERSVLGAAMIENSTFNDALAVIGEGSFFREAHKRIFRKMVKLHDQRKPIDIISVKEALEQSGELEDAGGPAYIASLVDGVPRSTNVEYYADVVRQKATLRALISAGQSIISDAYGAGTEADDILNKAESAVMSVAKTAVRGDFVHVEELVARASQRFVDAHENPRVVSGLPSGIHDLDKRTRGFQPGDVIYLAAGTSRGKTAMMLQMACAVAADAVAGMVSLEMSADSLIDRAVAQLAGVDAFRMKTGHLTQYEQQKCGVAFNQLSNAQLYVDDVVGLTATQMRAKVRRFASRKKLKALFIDYAQLMHESGKFSNRNEELSSISRNWKLLAIELNIPIIILSQLSRGGTKNDDDKPPTLADLRDSGALEQDADIVLLIWRHTEGGEKVVDLIIAKQRNGPTDTIRLRWFAEQMRFASPDESPNEEHQAAMAL